MLKFPLTLLSVLTTAIKRLRANFGLALCALIALVAAVALSVSVPIYAEGASLRLLQGTLARQERQTNRSAFALLFRYLSSSKGPLEWERVKPVDDFISGPGLARLQLPLQGLARHVRTDPLRMLLPPSSGARSETHHDARIRPRREYFGFRVWRAGRYETPRRSSLAS